jgi:hypothetical protein
MRVQRLWNIYTKLLALKEKFLQKLHIQLSYDLAIALLGI